MRLLSLPVIFAALNGVSFLWMMDTATDERVAYFGRGYNLAAHQLMVCRTSALVAPATTAAAAAAVVV